MAKIDRLWESVRVPEQNPYYHGLRMIAHGIVRFTAGDRLGIRTMVDGIGRLADKCGHDTVSGSSWKLVRVNPNDDR